MSEASRRGPSARPGGPPAAQGSGPADKTPRRREWLSGAAPRVAARSRRDNGAAKSAPAPAAGAGLDRRRGPALGDTVSGVPYLEPPECDSCRVALSRSAVDSIRTGNPVGGFLRTTAVVYGVGLLLVLSLGDSQGCAFGN